MKLLFLALHQPIARLEQPSHTTRVDLRIATSVDMFDKFSSEPDQQDFQILKRKSKEHLLYVVGAGALSREMGLAAIDGWVDSEE